MLPCAYRRNHAALPGNAHTERGHDMSAIASAGQTYPDVIEAKLASQASWLKLAQDLLLACPEINDEYAARLANYRSEKQRYLALVELAQECGLRD